MPGMTNRPRRLRVGGEIGLHAIRSSRVHIYFPEDYDHRLSVGDDLVLSVYMPIEDRMGVDEEKVAEFLMDVVGVTTYRLGSLPNCFLLPDVKGYRSRRELSKTLERIFGNQIDSWSSVVTVVSLDRIDIDGLDLKEFNQIFLQEHPPVSGLEELDPQS